jgi:hypothetical protein
VVSPPPDVEAPAVPEPTAAEEDEPEEEEAPVELSDLVPKDKD